MLKKEVIIPPRPEERVALDQDAVAEFKLEIEAAGRHFTAMLLILFLSPAAGGLVAGLISLVF